MGFCSDDPMNVPAKFEVRSVTCSWDNRGTQKISGSPPVPILTLAIPQKTSYRPTTQTIPLCALVFPQFSIGVLAFWDLGSQTSNLGEGERKGWG